MDPTEPPAQGSAQFQLVVVDAPFVVDGGVRVPSMVQSLDVAWDLERGVGFGVHAAMDAWFPDDVGARKGVGLAVSWALVLPHTVISGWMHEEWHRAVLVDHDVASRNGVWFPDAWSNGTISVDHVSDDDLSRLKAEDPGSYVRLMSAGLEAQHALASRFGDEAFVHLAGSERIGPFLLGDTWGAPVVFANRALTWLYFARCGPGSDLVTDEENQLRVNVPDRDFTGLDCDAWAYDVSRPDEPYTSRGPHPYGEGIDRYRSWEDLDARDRALLRTQQALMFLNAVDPHLLGVNGFAAGEGRWFVRLGHQLAPFGYAVEAHGGVVAGGHTALATASVFVTADGRASPGGEVQWVDQPLGGPWGLDAGVAFWSQPAEARFDGRQAPGGRLEAELAWRVAPRWDLTFGASAKSAGWSPGSVALGPAWGSTLGLVLHAG